MVDLKRRIRRLEQTAPQAFTLEESIEALSAATGIAAAELRASVARAKKRRPAGLSNEEYAAVIAERLGETPETVIATAEQVHRIVATYYAGRRPLTGGRHA